MNTWNQWGAAGYAAIPGYAAPQATAAAALPAAAAALPPAAAAAAAAAAASAATVPYPGVAGFQAWPYAAAAAPQALTPWGAPAATPAAQSTQWEQWSQWQQQYAQWQQQYAAQTAASTALTTTPTAKGVQPVAGSAALTMTTNSTITASQSGNAKRPNDAAADSLNDPKKPRIEGQAWNQASAATTAPVSASTSKELEELSEAEKQFDEQFKNWESQFDTWRQQNANHPDIEQYKAYEAKWASWREQLLARREQMKKKREKLMEQAVQPKPPEPLALPPDPSAVLNPMAQMYPGYTAPGAAPSAVPSAAPSSASQYQPPYGSQAQFMSGYTMPSAPLSQATPALPPQTSGGGGDAPPSEFIKSGSSNGIPGLDLLSGGASQPDTKTLPPVSFPSTTSNLPIQTPADSKPFDFPPPRQSPVTTSQSQYQPTPTPVAAGMPPMYPGIMQPGFPFQPGQTPAWPSYQGGVGYQAPSTGYQTGATGSAPFQTQAPTGSYQPPGLTGFQAQPPPSFQPPVSGYMPPATSQFPGSFPPTPQPSYPNQQPPSSFQDPSKPGFPYNQQPPPTPVQGSQQNFNNQEPPKKLPGLMDNLSNFGDRNSDRGDNFNRNPDDKFGNKFNQDRFGNQDKFGDKNRMGKDMGYTLPKPKGYFSMQEMSEEEEYEKFHEYQQKGDEEEDEKSKYDKFNKSSRFDGPPPRFDDKPSRFEDDRGPRFDDGKASRFSDGGRPRFEGGARMSRFEPQGPNKFPPEKDNFNRPPFEGDDKRPPLLGNTPAMPSLAKGPRASRWGGPEEDREPEKGVGRDMERGDGGAEREKPYGVGGGLGPPYGATADGSDFRIAVIVDYKHTAANLGVPDYFEPVSIIDYTHGLDGIRVKEPIDEDWDKGKTAGPHVRGRDSPREDRIRDSDDRRSWQRPDERRDRGPMDDRRSDDRRGPPDDRRGQFDDRRDRGGAMDDRRGPMDDRRSDDRRGHPDDRRGPPDDRRGPPNDRRGPPDDRRGPPDDRRGPFDDRRGPQDDRRGPPMSRWSEHDDRDRRKDNVYSRSPERSRPNDRLGGGRDNDRDRRDRERKSRSPARDNKQGGPEQSGPAQGGPEPQTGPREVLPVDDLLVNPGRQTRPAKIAIFIRGPPGSGKSFVARLIKDKEVSNGGTAPRILSLDDYFMADVEKEIPDSDTGRLVKQKVMEYEFDAAMEVKYRESLNKCFRKTVTDGYFPFIIVDANNDKIAYFDSMVNFCKVRGFSFYIVEMEQDVAQCAKRNIHKRSEKDIETLVKGFEPSLSSYPLLDITSLLQDAAIPEVDMEDSMDVETPEPQETEADKPAETPVEEKKPEETPEPNKEPEKPRTIGSMGGPLLRNPGPPSRTGFRFQTRPPMFHNPHQWGPPRRGFGGPMWRNAVNRRR